MADGKKLKAPAAGVRPEKNPICQGQMFFPPKVPYRRLEVPRERLHFSSGPATVFM
jgi:hypothetical protein